MPQKTETGRARLQAGKLSQLIMLDSPGRRLNGSLGLSLNDRTITFLVVLVDKTVSVG